MWSLGVLGVLLILGVLEGPREAKTGKKAPAFWTKAARGELGDEEWREFIRWGELGSIRINAAEKEKNIFSGLSVCRPRWTSRCLCTGGTWLGCTPGPRCC